MEINIWNATVAPSMVVGLSKVVRHVNRHCTYATTPTGATTLINILFGVLKLLNKAYGKMDEPTDLKTHVVTSGNTKYDISYVIIGITITSWKNENDLQQDQDQDHHSSQLSTIHDASS